MSSDDTLWTLHRIIHAMNSEQLRVWRTTYTLDGKEHALRIIRGRIQIPGTQESRPGMEVIVTARFAYYKISGFGVMDPDELVIWLGFNELAAQPTFTLEKQSLLAQVPPGMVVKNAG